MSTIRHRFVSTKADQSDSTLLRPSDFGSTSTNYATSPTHTFNGGALGSLLYRDTGAVDGSNWLTPAGAGLPYWSGAGVAPTLVTVGSGLQVAGGVLSSTAAVPGSNTQLIFNDGGAFGADSGLTFNKTTDALTIAGGLSVNGGSTGGLTVVDDGTSTLLQMYDGATERLRLRMGLNQSSFFNCGDTGFFGIGTNAPVSKLTLTGPNAWIIQDEQDTNPTATELDANDSIAIYNKANKLVFAYNNAGTITYVSLPLDGSSTTWTHSTSAP